MPTNDAPALASADVGIATGTGTDVAIEAADVVLISADLNGVVNALHIIKRTIRNICQSLFWMIGYNALLTQVTVGVLYLVFGGEEFHVITLSTDTGKISNMWQLYVELGLDTSEIFIDETGTAMRTLGIFAMPTTLLIDPQRREIGRKPGPADWDDGAPIHSFTKLM